MAIGSKDLAITELDTFADEKLVEELKKAKAELFNLRFQSATGQLESHGRVRQVKRDIARIYTVLRERELGIRATPAAEKAPAKKSAAKKSTKTEPADAAESSTETKEA
ncbi:MAG: 50S ribosomal protein L29 [Leucobacter sp.]|nr:50S ribosomal protein L29 [Leucobacter sp.]